MLARYFDYRFLAVGPPPTTLAQQQESTGQSPAFARSTCWYNVGPSSATLAQLYTNIGQTLHVDVFILFSIKNFIAGRDHSRF